MSFNIDPSLYAGEIKQPNPSIDPHGHPIHHHLPIAHSHPQHQSHPAQQQPPIAPMNLSPLLATVAAAPPPPSSLPQQSDVDDLLRKKRKAREHKACYPCRQRKVKCDLSRPCQTCRDRDHPELCAYHPPNKRQHNTDQHQHDQQSNSTIKPDDGSNGGYPSASSPSLITLGRGEFELLCRKLNGLENQIADLRREMSRSSIRGRDTHFTPDPDTPTGTGDAGGESDANNATEISSSILAPPQPREQRAGQPLQIHTDRHGLHTRNEAGEIVHFGAGSIPAMLFALRDGNAANQIEMRELLGKSVLPMFGLDNESATYPFVDLWGLPHGSIARAKELAEALPPDAQMMNLVHIYRQSGEVVLPAVVDPDALEADLANFLVTRAANKASHIGVSEHLVYGKTFYWLGLLFSVLASGAQCAPLPRNERELTAQVYVCCAMECARFTNFISQPNLETIQTLLVVQHVLTNNMNAGTAWSLLGLTIRLAQGLGIHRPCPPDVRLEHAFPRSKVWWAIIWQDSLLSIIYDRATGATVVDDTSMPMPTNYGQVGEYHASMYRLAKVGLDIVRDRSHSSEMEPRDIHARIAQHRDDISAIMRGSAEYLRDSRKCATPREALEHWGLYMHTSYYLSELCRPSISTSKAGHDIIRSYKPLCIENLINTIEAFLGLDDITPYASQSWAAVHRGLSSALLLGILGEHKRNERARQLLGRFISAMYKTITTVDPEEVAAPIQRGIAALRKLNLIGHSQSDGVSPELGNEGISLNENGSLKVDASSVFTPPTSDHDSLSQDEGSPYSILNTILWGASNANADVAGLRYGIGALQEVVTA